MRIGIFGGSFNPPHKMHEDIARELIEANLLDKIIFVPTGSKYKYKNNLLPDKYRLAMTNIITSKYDYLETSDYEMQDEVVYTCETLEYFKGLYPNDEIYFICGADNLSYMDKWKNGEYILTNYKIIVINRDTNNLEDILTKFLKYRSNIIVADITSTNLSSTFIREQLMNSQDIKNYVDTDVIKYIQKNKLYLGEKYGNL